MIVDTHVHVFSDDRTKYPTIRDDDRGGSIPTIAQIGQSEWPLTRTEDLLAMMDEAGVDKATLVQAYFIYEYDNSYTIDSTAAHPDRFAAVVILDPTDPASPDALSRLADQGATGLRFMRGRIPECTLGNPETLPLWQRAAELGMAVSVNDRIHEVHRLKPVLAQFPSLPIAVEHAWGHKVGDPPFDLLAPLFELAAYPNAHIKTAINNTYAVREGTGTPEQLYGKLLETFGANRIMWSSNYPAHPRMGSMAERLRAAYEDYAFMSEADRRAILGGTALRLWPSLQ